jgi:hypothetical protein
MTSAAQHESSQQNRNARRKLASVQSGMNSRTWRQSRTALAVRFAAAARQIDQAFCLASGAVGGLRRTTSREYPRQPACKSNRAHTQDFDAYHSSFELRTRDAGPTVRDGMRRLCPACRLASSARARASYRLTEKPRPSQRALKILRSSSCGVVCPAPMRQPRPADYGRGRRLRPSHAGRPRSAALKQATSPRIASVPNDWSAWLSATRSAP